MKCQARIVREYKTVKAESAWPPESEADGIIRRDFPDSLKYPQCDGDVTASVRLEAEPYYGGVDYRLVIELECSRCRWPYIRGFEKIQHEVVMTGVMDVSEVVMARCSS